ncbi:Fe-S oxidoreductase [Sphingobium xenophagum]|uniref:Fe-S oxidoreductase n=1 Tax=Sphingobium xenophagum TaxID=121428 RepID=A0ABU1X5K1_SPHXE|nr:(Fe-S)-binding protein [Sphingobium xenophagum]MDR7156836.1 Fe-S oxidoreductase [Sphingobium xenophagum]
MAHCWRCSHCKWVPSPKSHDFAHACPSIQWGGFHAYSGGGKVITAYAVSSGDVECTEETVETVFACSMCGACDIACKNNNGELIEPLSVLYALRADVVARGAGPLVHNELVQKLRRFGNSTGRPREDRSKWADGLKLADATDAQVDVLLHIGCENAFDPSRWGELRAITALLIEAGIRFGIAYDKEAATGETAFDLGYQDDARALAKDMIALIGATGARTVVTCSATSYHGMVNIWPRLGLACPTSDVRHVTDFIDDLFESGALRIDAHCDATVTYHDPCKLGRLGERFEPSDAVWTKVLNTFPVRDKPTQVLFGNDGVYEPPRNLLRRINGLKLVEMERTREAAYCCGAAGGAKEGYSNFAGFAAQNRLTEALATGASIVATSCGACRGHLAQVAGENSVPLEVMGVFELLMASASKKKAI